MSQLSVFAHTRPGAPETEWEPLATHLVAVGARAAEFASEFGAEPAGLAAGLLHDIGKCSAEFQQRLHYGDIRCDHATAGARVAVERYPGGLGKLLAFGIAGHHAGLADGTGDGGGGPLPLDHRLSPDAYQVPAFIGWEAHAPGLPELGQLATMRRLARGAEQGFETAFFARMLFSCLVDADSLATEAFVTGEVARGGALHPGLLAALRAHMAGKRRLDTAVNRLRAEVLDHAVVKAALEPGLFTLTVPTGGGKTLASLAFALEHAARHDLRRVVYVIPFTSIIEQTAQVFREALRDPGAVLEHHASFDWERAPVRDDEGADGREKLKRAAENWDASVVVTTAVQFFESLFAARRSRCRKLHNLARSVIVLDEAQTLPLPLLRPCMAAIGELARNYGASVVLCTATQPALRVKDGALLGRDHKPAPFAFAIGEERELAPDPERLYTELTKRVTVERLEGQTPDSIIVERFVERQQMLVIVNTRTHARALFEGIAGLEGARHLTTLMCAAHRQKVLAEVKVALDPKNAKPVRLVATSLIEAGVDVDFPEVWRAATGLDSIAQAAGRCNRESKLETGRVVVFEPVGKLAPAMVAGWQAACHVFRNESDILGIDAVRSYFWELYFNLGGVERLDAATLAGKPFPIMAAIAEAGLDFPFSRIARAFRMIDETMVPVLIAWDAAARNALDRLRHAERAPIEVLRALGRYTVPVPEKARAAMLAVGAAESIGPKGTPFVVLVSGSLYDPALGLKLDDPTFRSAESNVMS